MKKILAMLILASCFMTACGQAEDSITTAETTTTTTAAETTTAETTTTAKLDMTLSDERTLDNGIVEKTYIGEDQNVMIELYFPDNDDPKKNILNYADIASQTEDNFAALSFKVSSVDWRAFYNDDKLAFSRLSQLQDDGTYSASLGFVWYDDSYKNAYNDLDNDTTTTTITTTTTEPTTTTAAVTEQVLYDNNGIKITFKGMDYTSSMFGPAMKLLIENNTDKNYIVQDRDFSVNGFMISTTMSADVNAGKKTNDTLVIKSWSLEENSISENDIQSIEFTFHIFNDDDWSDAIDTETINIEL